MIYLLFLFAFISKYLLLQLWFFNKIKWIENDKINSNDNNKDNKNNNSSKNNNNNNNNSSSSSLAISP